MAFVGKNKANTILSIGSSSVRYFLLIEVTDKPKNPVIVIMKNPSTTCKNIPNSKIISFQDKKKCWVDRTTGIIYRHLKKTYDCIIVLNLYAYYSTKANCIQSHYYTNLKQANPFLLEDFVIMESISLFNKAPIICAWGGPSGIDKFQYDKRINDVIKITGKKRLFEYDLMQHNLISIKGSKNHYPLHGLKWK